MRHFAMLQPVQMTACCLFLQGFTLKKVQHLVLDEADRLLNMDFEEEINQILKVLPKERRTQLFSATMTTKVAKLQRACLQVSYLSLLSVSVA